MKLAQKHKVPIRCVLFTAPAKLCEHNDAVRALSASEQVSLLSCFVLHLHLNTTPGGRQLSGCQNRQPSPQQMQLVVHTVHGMLESARRGPGAVPTF